MLKVEGWTEGTAGASCGDLVLSAVLSRRQTERYSHEYSSTQPNSRHPAGSTVSLKCTGAAPPLSLSPPRAYG